MEQVIGLEVHQQLKTATKLFCTCSADYRDEVNTNLCPRCTAQPGAKPMGINQRALEAVIKIGLMLGCDISESVVVQRKHYFYPDLPNNYQRTSTPIATGGKLGGVRIREVHIEEDPGRFDLRRGIVDFNRAGVPLIEIVTEPDMSSPKEARDFLKSLRAILSYLEVAREEAGSMRCDANTSVKGHPRVEVKNINSDRGVFKALGYEFIRQKNKLKRGGEIKMETRHFDDVQNITLSLREKESVADYRYIPDPDVPPIIILPSLVKKLEKSLPESPRDKAERFVKEYGIPEDLAGVLVDQMDLALLFEEAAEEADASEAAKFICGELKRVLNWNNLSVNESGIEPHHVTELLSMMDEGEITDNTAHQLIEELVVQPRSPSEIVSKRGLSKLEDWKELEKLADKIADDFPDALDDLRSGREEALHFLVGKAVARTSGRADPIRLAELFERMVYPNAESSDHSVPSQ